MYYLERIPADFPAWRLTKTDGTQYDVHDDGSGAQCTCWDFITRRDGTANGCKHICACHEAQIL